MDYVDLEFEEDALKEIAKRAVVRKSGARGLTGIVEEAMLDVMFEVPSRTNVEKVIITKKSIKGEEEPIVVTRGTKALTSNV